MLIVCPTCASQHRVETARVGMEGRSVRCAACRETWFVSPAEVLAAREAELEAEAGPALEATVSEAAWGEATAAVRSASADAVIDNVPPAPRGGRARKQKPGYKPLRSKGTGRLSPAMAAGLVVLAAIPLACLARVPVVQALPQAAGLFARIGLPVNLRGLEIRDVAALRSPADGTRPAELSVEGDLVGVARDGAPVPQITVTLRDAAARIVQTYTIDAPRSRLAAGETARFSGRFPDPPEAARGIEVRFSDLRGEKRVEKQADAGAH